VIVAAIAPPATNALSEQTMNRGGTMHRRMIRVSLIFSNMTFSDVFAW
jgi:hypothetical protein